VPIDNVYAQMDVTKISVSPTVYDIDLYKAISLEAKTRYWVVMDANYPSGDTNLVYWVGSYGNGYTGGDAAYLSRGAWNTDSFASTLDFAFGVGCFTSN
jgi:hypothetical protein